MLCLDMSVPHTESKNSQNKSPLPLSYICGIRLFRHHLRLREVEMGIFHHWSNNESELDLKLSPLLFWFLYIFSVLCQWCCDFTGLPRGPQPCPTSQHWQEPNTGRERGGISPRSALKKSFDYVGNISCMCLRLSIPRGISVEPAHLQNRTSGTHKAVLTGVLASCPWNDLRCVTPSE